MKKVLSLVLAAAMTLGLAATSFAKTSGQNDSSPSYMQKVLTDANIDRSVGKTHVDTLTADNGSAPSLEIKAGDSANYRFAVVAIVNTSNKDGVIDYNYHDLEAYVNVKGPATASKENLDKESFRWWTVGDKTYLYVEGTFKLAADNTAATEMKGIVVEYGVKPVNAPSRSGLKKGSNTFRSIEVGYSNEDVAAVYDAVVEGWEEMDTYGENSFEVALGDNPVIPSSAIRFLQKNLADDKSVIFVLDGENDSTYFNGSITVELNGANIKKLSSSKHVNIKTAKDAGPWDTLMDGAEFDSQWFNFVAPKENIEGTYSVEANWDWKNAHVYLIKDDGTWEDVTKFDSEDYPYGDVVFSGSMTRYLITEDDAEEYLTAQSATAGDDEPIEDDDLIDEPTEDDDNLVDEDGNPIENNPGTGSSNAISLAVAMAVVSLAAAGLVATKKASK